MSFSLCASRALLLIVCFFSWSLAVNAADYYWVGGTGDWSDIMHWATTSGGAVTHAQAPSPNDDVYFDANAFTAAGQTVTLNINVIFCRSMDWTGVTNAPVFEGGENVTMSVYGSLLLVPDVNFSMDGDIIFTGANAGNNVSFAGKVSGRFLTFSGAGDWTLTSDVVVDSTLFFNEGTLNTNGRTVMVGNFHSDTDADRTLNLGASQLTIRDSTFQPLWLDARNLTINPGTSVITLTGNRTEVYFEGPGAIDLNELLFTAPVGRSVINNREDANGVGSGPDVFINRLDLRHRTRLNGDYEVGTLELHPGQEYRIRDGSEVTMLELIAQGNCGASIDIASTSEAPAVFRSPVAITADFVSLRSIATAGTGPFTATNTIDLGDNNGWIINDRITQAFYWIGGTGFWKDPNHWATTSGGIPNGCLPSLADDVFFDANSFTGGGQTVTVNKENAACRNMDWTGATFNPTMDGPDDHQMQVAASLTFIAGMTHAFAGNYFFTASTTGQVLTSGGQPFNQDVTFQGGGEWTLGDDLYVKFYLDLLAGTFRTADHNLDVNFFRSDTGSERAIYLGNSEVFVQSRQEVYFYCEMALVTDNLTFDAGTSIINVQGESGGALNCFGNQPLVFNVVNLRVLLSGFFQNIPDVGGQPAVVFDSLLYFNSGSLGGNNLINYLYFTPGRTYELGANRTQTILDADINGDCGEGTTAIISNELEQQAMLNLPAGSTFERLFLRGIAVTDGAPAIADNSVDAGRNLGWTINTEASRTLYWVGGDGDWFERAYWSLTSGGVGGACIPTAIDDVIFDENASADVDYFVRNGSDRSIYCRNIDWTAGVTNINYFEVGRMRVGGSFTNAGNLEFGASPVFFFGNGDHSITMGGASFNEFTFEQDDSYVFRDDFFGYQVELRTGELRFGNDNGELSRLAMVQSEQTKTLDLNNIHLRLTLPTNGFEEAFSVYGNANLIMETGNSLVELTSNRGGIRANSDVTLNRVLFSNPGGTGEIFRDDFSTAAFNAVSVTFNGNGTLVSPVTTDTLICVSGKSYVFEAGETQRINEYWRLIGNNCTPISLQSSVLGTQATASVPDVARVLANSVQMRDITGTGGNIFFAGARSTDIENSNVGWTFETAPRFETIGFLGEDRGICTDEPITISAYNYSPGETYLWSDGSTDTTFTTNVPGTYEVAVTFDNNCVIRDEIIVIDAQALTVDLFEDPTICAGDTLELVAEIVSNATTYLWQDGSVEPTLEAFTAGEYRVTVTVGGCLKFDATTLAVTPLPTVAISGEEVACAGDNFILTGEVTAESFFWQDGSTDLIFTGNQAGVYHLTVTNGNCSVSDSIAITYITPATVDLGNDSTLCDASLLILDATTPGYEYTWQDGSTNATFTVTESGRYFVEIDTAGCMASDTIDLVVSDQADFGVDEEYTECAGAIFELTTIVPADAIRWSNGQTGPDFSTSAQGNYEVAMDFGACTAAKTFLVTFQLPPAIDFGPDTTSCEGTPVLLNTGVAGTWQDGTFSSVYPVTEAGNYRVSVVDGPCVVVDSLRVSFLASPDISLGEDQLACEGEPLTVVTDFDAGATLLWDDGLTSATRDFRVGGVRAAVVTDENGCTSRDSVTLTFQVPPTLGLPTDTIACDDRPLVLEPLISGGALSWPDGSSAESYLVLDPGMLLVTLTEGICSSRAIVDVNFQRCVVFKAYMPSAFSPNFDGINDEFGMEYNDGVEIMDFRMEVFDRWGALVFRSDDVNKRWEGTRAGKAVEMGVYVYAIEVFFRDDRETGSRMIGGDVTVIR